MLPFCKKREDWSPSEAKTHVTARLRSWWCDPTESLPTHICWRLTARYLMQRDHTDTQFKRLSENLETAEVKFLLELIYADLPNGKNIRLCLMRQKFGLARPLKLHNKAESEYCSFSTQPA